MSLRASGYVRRYHTVPFAAQQNVAEHSGQAITLLLYLHPNPSLRLIKAVAWHDAAERVTGDVPSTAKTKFDALREAVEAAEMRFFMDHPSVPVNELDDEEYNWLRSVDLLECILWCRDAAFAGNKHADIMFKRAFQWLLKATFIPQPVHSFAYWVCNTPYESFV